MTRHEQCLGRCGTRWSLQELEMGRRLLDTSYHARRHQRRMRDPAYREAYLRATEDAP